MDSVIAAVIGVLGSMSSAILVMLINHEKRLTRIEAKIDLILRLLNSKNNQR